MHHCQHWLPTDHSLVTIDSKHVLSRTLDWKFQTFPWGREVSKALLGHVSRMYWCIGADTCRYVKRHIYIYIYCMLPVHRLYNSQGPYVQWHIHCRHPPWVLVLLRSAIQHELISSSYVHPMLSMFWPGFVHFKSFTRNFRHHQHPLNLSVSGFLRQYPQLRDKLLESIEQWETDKSKMLGDVHLLEMWLDPGDYPFKYLYMTIWTWFSAPHALQPCLVLPTHDEMPWNLWDLNFGEAQQKEGAKLQVPKYMCI